MLFKILDMMEYHEFFVAILWLNGIYDVACSLGILIDAPIFSRIHIDMLISKEDRNNKLVQRYLAYWIMTYGLVRLFGDFHIAAFTYLVEGWGYLNESIATKKVHYDKGIIVSITCFVMAYHFFTINQ